MTAAKVIEFPAKRAVEARPVNKLRVLEQVRHLICKKELPRSAILVVQYLGEITDRHTGAAVVELNTIAERIGTSRATVVRALQKLTHKDVGLVKRNSRRKGKRCFATEYRLVDAEPEVNRPQVTDEPTPVHPCTTFPRALKKPSPECLSPDGLGPASDHARQDEIETETDEETWIDLAEWLAREGNFKRWADQGGMAYRLAREDLDRWRAREGDRAILKALANAKRAGLYGNNLIDFLENTGRGRKRRPGRRQCDREGVMAVGSRVAARGDES